MNIEDMIKEEREIIEELKIDDSKKKNMLKAFDEIVSLYQGTIAEAVAEAFGYTAYYTNSEEAIIETAKTLALYHNKKVAGKVAEAIAETTYNTKSEEATIETAKILALYYNKEEAEIIANTIGSITNDTKNEEAIIETVKTLALHHDKKGAEKVAKVIKDTAFYTRSEKAVIETAKTLRNTKDIYNLDSKLYKEYFLNISDNLSKKIKDSLSIKDINKITNTYSLTMDFCTKERWEFREKVKKGFFYHLNKATDKGKTIENKIKILNKWSDNVYTTFKNHPEDFMEFLR